MIMKNDYFYNIVYSAFEKKTFNFVPPIKMNINANKITIYNGLEIPQSKLNLDKLIKYINVQIYQRYIDKENFTKEEKNKENIDKYYKEIERLKENIKTDIDKYEFFKIIYSQNTIVDGVLSQL